MDQVPKLECPSCEGQFDEPELDDGGACPDCGEQILQYAGPSRGSAAEFLADEIAEADTEEERDVYHALLHLLACNLLTKKDISSFIHFGQTTENLDHVIGKAYENAEAIEGGDVVVCPNCDEKIKSWARWYDAEYSNSVSPNRSV